MANHVLLFGTESVVRALLTPKTSKSSTTVAVKFHILLFRELFQMKSLLDRLAMVVSGATFKAVTIGLMALAWLVREQCVKHAHWCTMH